eukprot:Lithocolla_globosa_v1_NODE_2925_length_1821_cov_26.362401.p1 type:complete len:425 gc:universal NODE_2925_length_1821_cov_26.362401:1413-139(-)
MANVPLGPRYKVGLLIKQGIRVKNWKRRFFVLDKENKVLKYFETENSPQPKGTISLQGYVVADAEEITGKSFSFQISKTGARTYYMVAERLDEKESWMRCLSSCLEWTMDDFLSSNHMDELQYPMYVISQANLTNLSRLISHEEALKQGLLFQVLPAKTEQLGWYRLVDGHGQELGRAKPSDCFVGISHHWLTVEDTKADKKVPDDENNTKLQSLKYLIENKSDIFTVEDKRYVPEYLWIDFLCVPQNNRDLQIKAILSLPSYLKVVYNFVAIVSDPDDLKLYQGRSFCLLECWLHRTPRLHQHKEKACLRVPKNQKVLFQDGTTKDLDWSFMTSPLQGETFLAHDMQLIHCVTSLVLDQHSRYQTCESEITCSSGNSLKPGDVPKDVLLSLRKSWETFEEAKKQNNSKAVNGKKTSSSSDTTA